MKKTIAGIAALTIALSAFAGCKDRKNDKSTGGASEAVTTAAQQDTTVEKTTAQDTTAAEKTTASSDDPSASAEGYEKVLREFIDAYNNEDYKKTFELTMPDGAEKVMKLLASSETMQNEYGGISDEEMIKESQESLFLGKKDGTLVPGEIKKTEPLTEEETFELRSEIAMITLCLDYIDSHGGAEDVDAEAMLNEIMDYDLEAAAAEVELDKSYYITFGLENEKWDWSGDGNAIVYRVRGGSWKISANDLIGTLSGGKDKRLNTAADSLYKAANTVLIELDEEGHIKNDSDEFIVSSDSSKDFNVPADFDADLFRSRIKNYCDYEGDWFVKMQGAYALETAVFDSEKPHNVGTYPPSDYVDFAYEGMSYDEIYNKACEDIG
ncbi:hypothetical protein [Ruminococcus flavefaciens]|uniref:Uncharacterized protein n=1 Tax=Ruminococcus flavefaciens TaxID=1265 RepID=A0A315XXA4_RUMFL|nr:hypothetical protein [Ruminococcus flavefaciens]PWJ11647.1 hypothetical protein IE37_02412 [Ruminococcus flavefaciens]SSA50556.1 hypothetical protein SAMN02910325_02412 [Ruminococcus flavefaciens]